MNRLFIALFLLFLGLPASRAAKVKYPGRQTFVYRYYLRDKQGCGFSVDHPSRFLSPKAIERRKRQHLRIDSTDLPVSRKYVDLFRQSKIGRASCRERG